MLIYEPAKLSICLFAKHTPRFLSSMHTALLLDIGKQATIRRRVCGSGLMKSVGNVRPYDDFILGKVGFREAARESILKRSTLLAGIILARSTPIPIIYDGNSR